ncbi:MAG: AAA family ATPase [Bacteroidales bacterium]|nr:AAA family ATPase [Bacteroidales bacterium]
MDTATRDLVERLIFSFFPHQPTTGQKEACTRLADFLFDPDPAALFLLKGYAGTGKTSLVSALIQAAPSMQISTLLLAPTGRAAKVLGGYSHKTAYTIHKKIYATFADANGTLQTLRAKNRLDYTLFIVDEASLIGAQSLDFSRRNLLEDLVDFVQSGNHCRLLLIGDAAQLPPVGLPESLALSGEYLRSTAHVKLFQCELTEVVRQERESGILRNATLLRSQIANMRPNDTAKLPLFNLEGCDDIMRLPGDQLEETLHTAFGNGQEEAVIITRSNKRASQYNQAIRNRIIVREEMVNAGDYLMVAKNNYHWLEEGGDISFIANGDIVEVMGLRNHQELYGFHFADATLRFVDYPLMGTVDCKLLLDTLVNNSPALAEEEGRRLYQNVLADYGDLPDAKDRLREVKRNPYFNALQVKFSYALTCHKAQGGQWPVVFIDQGYFTEEMLTRDYLRWLYTALTRATKRVYLIGFQNNFFYGDMDE